MNTENEIQTTPTLPALIPFSGVWRLLEHTKPTGFVSVLCVLQNGVVAQLNYSESRTENNGFLHAYSTYEYVFEENPVIYWAEWLNSPI